jgi:Arc/MetJ-type ribon-helix-helix transcriptional regulator
VQLVTRVDDRLGAEVDALVSAGVVESRSDAVRQALEDLVDRHRRREIGAQIVDGYRRQPQGDDDGYTDEATLAMIAEEPW